MFNILVKSNTEQDYWMLTCMYGSPYTALRQAQWDYLAQQSCNVCIPWVIVGDLNITLHTSEKQSFSTHTAPSHSSIVQAIDQMGLMDVPFSGSPFTWCNNRQQSAQVRVRLDRALATPNWLLNFKNALVYHLLPVGSDHSPILLQTDSTIPLLRRPFRCYEFWFKYPQCREIIESSWNINVQGSHAYKLATSLKSTKFALIQWAVVSFGEITAKINHTQSRLQTALDSHEDQHHIQELKEQLTELYEVYNNILFQQSREHILKSAYRNTKYFHSKANYRRRRNHIDSLQDEEGNWCSSREDITKLLTQHFQSICTSSNPLLDADLLSLIPKCVTEEDNSNLTAIPSAEEVKDMAFHIKPWAAPRPDGF